MKPGVAFTLLLACCATLQAATEQRLMFSPNGDGVKDDVTFRLAIQQNAAVSSWLFEIKNEAGGRIKKFSGTGLPPKELKWEGKDLDNRIVQDGTYFYSLSLVTEAGNQVAIAPSPVIVTRVPPQAALSVEPTIFSPGSSGPKGEARFTLTASDNFGIYSWLLTIKDKDGAAARQIGGKGSPSALIKWNGRGDFEEDLPDGKYAVELTVEDPAGNRATTPPRPIAIKRSAPVSTVEIVPNLFSPNGDGYKDDTAIKINSADPENVNHWTLRILNQSGKTVREFSGEREPPARLIWDGRIGEREKNTAEDGTYQVVLTEVDVAGNTSTTVPQQVIVDDTPPLVEARLEPLLLSPNGKGYHKEGAFYLKAVDANPLDHWSLTIVNDVGAPVKIFHGAPGSHPPLGQAWDGAGDDGNTLIDGTYGYILEAVDLGGNKAATPKQTLRIDTTPPLINISLNDPLFSPNGDAAHNQAIFKLSIQDAGPLESWRLVMRDGKNAVVRTFTGPADAVPPQLAWDGKNQDRAPLPDGDYTYVVEAKDVAGNAVASAPQKVTIGATRPTPEISSELRAISPNADGYKDETTFHMKAPAFNRIVEWTLKILDKEAAGRDKQPLVRRTFQGRGDVSGNIVWLGDGDDRRTLPDGEYLYVLAVVDAAGNHSESRPGQIRIDTTPPELVMKVSPNPYSPNGDGFKDEAIFTVTYQDASPIGDWRLSCRNTRQKVVRTFSGKEQLPLSITWKGDGDDGTALPDGPYTCVFSASDDVGNKSSTPDQIVRLVNTPPQVALQADPTLFSPVAEQGKNETTLLLDAKADADMSTWKLTLSGKDLIARTFEGLGRPPRSLPWDGKNDRGHQVPDGTYSAVLAVTDEVGNTGKSPQVAITVDTSKPLVTVTAETEQLQDLVPQMTVVQTQSKDLVISLSNEVLYDTGQAVLKLKAYDTLMKAVNLVRRYPNRKVRIEGHADNVPIHNADFADNQQLSQGRANAVLAFFKEKGSVDPSRMTAVGYGDTRPKASNDTEAGRRINRRVEIILLKETN